MRGHPALPWSRCCTWRIAAVLCCFALRILSPLHWPTADPKYSSKWYCSLVPHRAPSTDSEWASCWSSSSWHRNCRSGFVCVPLYLSSSARTSYAIYSAEHCFSLSANSSELDWYCSLSVSIAISSLIIVSLSGTLSPHLPTWAFWNCTSVAHQKPTGHSRTETGSSSKECPLCSSETHFASEALAAAPAIDCCLSSCKRWSSSESNFRCLLPPRFSSWRWRSGSL